LTLELGGEVSEHRFRRLRFRRSRKGLRASFHLE
jgi:hypothetical protein